MNITVFCARFTQVFPPDQIAKPTFLYGNRITRRFFDPCPDIKGMTSIKKQKLLNIAFSCLDKEEGYLEIGTFLGKSLISAMLGNSQHPVFACDNFSEFTSTNSYGKLQNNLRAYHLQESVQFYNDDFMSVLNARCITAPIGAYFYDGPHDEASHYKAIQAAEPLLAPEALVIIDDWRFAPDSQSFAKAGTQKALGESVNEWRLLYELPARRNGDRAMWWNGVAVYAFIRHGG